MKKYFVYTACSAVLLLASLQAQSTQDVQSFTNADLNSGAATTMTPSTGATATTQPQTQNAPFKYPELTPDQIQKFNDQMNAQVQVAEQRVQNLMSRVQDATRMPMSIDKVELEAAIMALDVKKTLASKFATTPSLRSPKVRQALMDIMQKQYLQESDLVTLQAIVNAERPYTYP